jgi:hypothetical protein
VGTLTSFYLFLRPGAFLSKKQEVQTKELEGSDQMPDSVERWVVFSIADVLCNSLLQSECFCWLRYACLAERWYVVKNWD